MYGGVDGVFPGKRLNRYSGSGAQRTTTDFWSDDNFDHTGLGFIGGGVIDARMEQKPIGTARAAAPSGARWGSEWKAFLAQNAISIGSIGTQLESLPYEDNFLDLDPTAKDPFGAAGAARHLRPARAGDAAPRVHPAQGDAVARGGGRHELQRSASRRRRSG